MRYTGSVANAFVQSIAHNFEQALRLMEAALTDCPDELWQTDLWPEEAPTAAAPHGGLHGSAPWFLGYHALTTLDYDLAGEFEPALHVVEHASQIRQFLTAAGRTVQPMPGDRGNWG